MADGARQRIAILGAGMGSLATAFHLTSEPGWQDRYEITVYQLGWRAGGKGASSRVPHAPVHESAGDAGDAHDRGDAGDPGDPSSALEAGGRIEEHGLHVWFGCYHEAFSLLRACYDELGRQPGATFATMESAFQAQDSTPYFEDVNGTWKPWPIWFPPNPSRPGTGGPLPTTWDYLVMVVESVARLFGHIPDARKRPPGVPAAVDAVIPDALRNGPETALRLLVRVARALPGDGAGLTARQQGTLVRLVDRAKARLAKRLAPELARNDRLRRLFIEADLGLTAIRGILADGVLRHGFGVIDDEDARAWFTRHGALPMTVQSTPVRALYDLYFAYDGGSIRHPSFSAGVAVGAVLRLAAAYKGSVAFEMRAGMGEVVIAPIYEALARRGVRFAFFHRVDALELTPDGRSVARVRLGQQVRLKDGTRTGYRPLIRAGDLPVWPAGPLLDQLDPRDAVRLGDTNLESRWNGWVDAAEVTLEAGADFDQVVLGISLAALPEIAGPLIDASVAWRAMVDGLHTTETMSVQLWMDEPLDALGWSEGPVPTDAGPETLDVWADRSETLRYEDWRGRAPRSVQYLCGPMTGDWLRRPPGDHDVPAEATAAVRALTERWLDEKGTRIWPRTLADGGFDWTVLHAPDTSTGVARLDDQFLRANIDPSERYVLSIPGSARYRLGAGESGFDNLVLAGDWTRTSWNVGCIDAAAESGRHAAAAVARNAGHTSGRRGPR